MNYNKIKELIGKAGSPAQVNKYLIYLKKLETETDNKKNLKNPWMKHKTDEYLAQIFVEVSEDGLVFDGQSITLQNTGVSYDYQAYKNKMLLAYPESIIDVGTVHEGDKFNFQKESGVVRYLHDIAEPFNRTEGNIKGAYAVIKNTRGDFLTLLSKADIDKHRKVARTDYIWKSWYMEMVMKTIMKKACKLHFNDIYSNIERIDNENYDLEKLNQTNDVKKITLSEDDVNWLMKFYKDQNITTQEDVNGFKKHYSFDPYVTTPEEFKAVKSKICEDYGIE